MTDPGNQSSVAPWLDATLRDIAALNGFAGDGALRLYQARILNGGGLRVVSPFTGRRVPLAGVLVEPVTGLVLHFAEGGRFALTVSELRLGYPVTSLTVAGRQLPCQREAVDALSQRLLQDGHYEAPLPGGFDPGAVPRLLTGSPNFAHFIWNEYPALRHLAPAHPGGLQALVLFDSLGILRQRLESLASETVFLESGEELRGWQPGPAAFAGALQCDAAAKAALLRDCGLEGLEAPPPGPPRFYLTIRSDSRTVEDQPGFLADLATRLLQTWPGSRLLLDGFSLPEDYGRPLYDRRRPATLPLVEGGRRIAAEVAAALPDGLRGRVSDITGRTLRAALREIGTCHYYVSHAGTSQHKIGWFFARPGCVHSNRPSIRPASLRWLASRTHGSLEPFSPDPGLIEDLDRIATQSRMSRNSDYRIRDRDAYIAAVLDDIRARLG